jgi:hypothetical protein
MWRQTYTDDAGTAIRLMRFGAWAPPPGVAMTSGKRLGYFASRVLSGLLTRLGVTLAVLGLVIVTLLVLVVRGGPFFIWLMIFSPVLGTITVLVCSSLGLLNGLLETRGDRIRLAMLHRGQCPSCGYELSSLPPRGDGLVECPECGSAWKLDVADRRTRMIVTHA